MMKKFFAAIAALLLTIVTLTACSPGGYEDYQERKAQQDATTLDSSIALDNLLKKRDLENDPNKVRYIYLMNYGQIVGYYVAVGNITSNSSQIAPEQEVVRPCSGCEGIPVDSAADDGTFGTGDPGIFFFTSDGTMIVTSLDYIQSDQPIAIDVPRLGGSE